MTEADYTPLLTRGDNMKKTFRVSWSEYHSIVIEAASEDEAYEKAQELEGTCDTLYDRQTLELAQDACACSEGPKVRLFTQDRYDIKWEIDGGAVSVINKRGENIGPSCHDEQSILDEVRTGRMVEVIE
jgi:hypothetical protein